MNKVVIPDSITDPVERRKAYMTAYDLEYRKENAGRLKAEKAVYRKSKRDYINQWHREHYQKNKESIGKQHKEYRDSHKEYFHKKSTDWARNNRERMKEIQKKYWAKNPDKLREKWARKGLKRRAKMRGSVIDTNRVNEFISSVRSKPSIPCYYCGKKISGKKAHIDHVVALARSGNHSVDNLCASCPKCNSVKHDRLISEWKKDGQQILNL